MNRLNFKKIAIFVFLLPVMIGVSYCFDTALAADKITGSSSSHNIDNRDPNYGQGETQQRLNSAGGRNISYKDNPYVTQSSSTDMVQYTKGVDDVNGKITIGGFTYGSITFPGTEIDVSTIPDGAPIYIYQPVAQNSGYITKPNGEREYVKAGTPLPGVLDTKGIQLENGKYSTAWAIENSRGAHVQMALEFYNQAVANGKLYDLITADGRHITWWAGIDLIEKLDPDLVKQILCPTGECETTEYTPKIPTLSCHQGSHAGWTDAQVKVKNFTTSNTWVNDVWARPGDTIQFYIEYCWGVGAVGGNENNDPSIKTPAIYPNGHATAYGKAVTDVWFQLSATPGDNYLFGKDEKTIGTSRHRLKDPHKENIGEAAPELASIDGDSELHDNYEFRYYSPSKFEDANGHNCSIFDFAAFTIGGSYGYQIPGVGTGSCSAISKSGSMSDAGKEITQKIDYSYDTAWQRYRHKEKGKCNNKCTWQPGEITTPGETGEKKYEDKDMNTLIENNTRVEGNPYKTLKDALNASGANSWGLIKKWSGDTDEHGDANLGDCDYDKCSAENWYSYPYYDPDCGCEQEKKVTCPDNDHDGNPDGNDCYTCARYFPGPCWGEYNEDKSEHDHDYPGKSHHKPEKDYTTGMQQLGNKSSSATVHIPYSYRTSTTASIQEGDAIYLGETVDSNFTASIIPRIVSEVRSGEAYATVVPGRIEAVEFIVNKDSKLSPSTGSSNAGSTGPCDYYRKLGIIRGCNTIWEEKGAGGFLNEEGRYMGKTYSSNVSRVVPDDVPIGSKYCVAVGISTSDSHSKPEAQVVSGMDAKSGWRISNLSCRTIAKKPNFQVWNGGFYTRGGIKTSTSIKRVGAKLGDPTTPTGYFGSWTEYFVNARYAIGGLSSGAGLGYYGWNSNADNSRSLGLQGGASPGKSFCNLSRMSIANVTCSEKDSFGRGYAGLSQIDVSSDSLIERIRSRYLNSTRGISVLDNGATYIYPAKEDVENIKKVKTSELRGLISKKNIGNTTISTKVIRQKALEESAKATQTTKAYSSNTLVIHVDKDLIIDTDICTGDGDCGTNSNELRLASRNSTRYDSIYGVPQVLIIVDGNVIIANNVTQIDAWIIAKGNVNTCDGLTVGSKGFDAKTCGRQLIINGPVFANTLTPVRNSGAEGGAGSGNNDKDHGGNPIEFNLTDDGSIQPAEIFNLRPDVLFWSFSQAQRFSQANVTYTRELAPRY